MSKNPRSREALIDFLGLASEKGLVKPATASNWRLAASRLLGILEPGEAEDVLGIDVDDVCKRFHNLEGRNVSPSSLRVYRSRLNTALKEFEAYLENPVEYRPRTKTRTSTSTKQRSGGEDRSGDGKKSSSAEPETQATTSPEPRSQHLVFPIPLRSDLVVEITGLPHDLTSVEAERIATVVKALAIPEV